MREISPALNVSANAFFSLMPSEFQAIVSRIRAEKESGTRSKPSSALIDKSEMLTPTRRKALLDRVALFVDENLAGRSEMCIQFAALLSRGLKHMGFDSKAVTGTATYFSTKGKQVFSWNHAWIRIGREVVDGNSDSLSENIMVPETVHAAPYWGPIKDVPGRFLHENGYVQDDSDVVNIWWPELKDWLENEFLQLP